MEKRKKSGLVVPGFVYNAWSIIQSLASASEGAEFSLDDVNMTVGEAYGSRMLPGSGSVFFGADGKRTGDFGDAVIAAYPTGARRASDSEQLYAVYAKNAETAGPDGEESWYGLKFLTEKEAEKTAQTGLTWDSPSEFYEWTDIRDIDGLIRQIGEMTGTAVTKRTVYDAYRAAAVSGNVKEVPGKTGTAYFPLNLRSKAGSLLCIRAKLNSRGTGPKYFGGAVVPEETVAEQFARTEHYMIGGYAFDSAEDGEKFLAGLALRAMPEHWDSALGKYAVLKAYVTQTYRRLKNESAVLGKETLPERSGYVFMNTGLLDRYYRELFIAAEKTEDTNGETVLAGASVVSSEDALIAGNFPETERPPMASFYTDADGKTIVLQFDPNLTVATNDSHVFEDGLANGRIPVFSEQWKKAATEEEKEKIAAQTAAKIQGALSRSRILAKRNPRFAVPQYWPEDGTIQYLLPLYIGDVYTDDIPDCVLALKEKTGTGIMKYYLAATVLTPAMAYSNARLLSRPDSTWIESCITVPDRAHAEKHAETPANLSPKMKSAYSADGEKTPEAPAAVSAESYIGREDIFVGSSVSKEKKTLYGVLSDGTPAFISQSRLPEPSYTYIGRNIRVVGYSVHPKTGVLLCNPVTD